MDWKSYEKNCYLLAKNEKQYLADGTFNQRIEDLIAGIPPEEQQRAISFLEKMVSYAPEYYEEEWKYLPVLIYKSESFCYGILNHFADCMKEALEELGECVEVFDCTRQPLSDLKGHVDIKYKAVLGFHSYLFWVKSLNGKLLHNYYHAPLYHMQLDHPVVMHKRWLDAPENLTVLTQDANYQKFLQKYYSDKVKAELLYPGGECCLSYKGEKQYNLTFVGSYVSWRDTCAQLKELNRYYKGMPRKLIYEMKHHPNATYEACFEKIVGVEENSLERQRELLYKFWLTFYCVMNYYRSKIVHTLLDFGLELHVYGDSWNDPEWAQYENLLRHPEVTPEESLQVYASSRLSLNIMSWHKAGMTERIANMLLCKTVVVSDKSDYLTGMFQGGEDMILFDLEKLQELPARIRELLSDETRMDRIAENGYRKAAEQHTWKQRAQQFLELVERQRNFQRSDSRDA